MQRLLVISADSNIGQKPSQITRCIQLWLNTVQVVRNSRKKFINNLLGNDQVVPVTIFLVTMYNACMLYQKDKTTNLLIPTLQRFDMIGKVDDNTFIDTMSEYLFNTYFLNFENCAHTYLTFHMLSITKWTDVLFWYALGIGYIVGNKITRWHNDPYKSKDWASSLVYNEFMHAWVTYELV